MFRDPSSPPCPGTVSWSRALPYRILLRVEHLLANFRPYTYWQLVILSCPISQHLASIFVFLAVFMRLQQRLLDPRALVWMSAAVFLAGYMAWELLDCSRVDTGVRYTNRS